MLLAHRNKSTQNFPLPVNLLSSIFVLDNGAFILMLPVVVRTCFQSSDYCIFHFYLRPKNLYFMIFVLDHLKIFLQNFVHTEYKAQLHASVQFVTSLCVFFFCFDPQRWWRRAGSLLPARVAGVLWGAPRGD
jgi:hypothetical protein